MATGSLILKKKIENKKMNEIKKIPKTIEMCQL